MSDSSRKEPVLTVTQITNAIKHRLEGDFPNVWLQGEVSNRTLHTSGHLYFSLKDENAQISAVVFRAKALLGEKMPKEGDNIIVHGSITLYPQAGRYQIVVREIKFAGLGELLLKLEEVKRKLNRKGYFNSANKKPLPKFPRKIGIVTSPTGAAIRDMLKILTARNFGLHIIINPVRVQGESASFEIARAIDDFNKFSMVDILIVGRGGGSFEDLWPFNEEVVADAIFNSKIPVIAAVGHETDHCIAEYTADRRAPTPTAAAEMIIEERKNVQEKLFFMRKNCDSALRRLFNDYRRRLITFKKQPLFKSPWAILGSWIQRIDELRQTLELLLKRDMQKRRQAIENCRKLHASLNPRSRITNFREKLRALTTQIEVQAAKNLVLAKERLTATVRALKSIDPKNLLQKGYSILFSLKDKSVINSVRKVYAEKEFKILLSDGEIISTIKGKNDE